MPSTPRDPSATNIAAVSHAEPALDIPVIAVVGPTASGKSEIAQRIAEHVGGEVVSADSMQVYRGLNVGTGKLMPYERRVPHHMLDIVDLSQPYSAAEYQTAARSVIEDCASRGVVPIVCGGTGLYLRAALDQMVFPNGEPNENALRAQLEAELASVGPAALYERLIALDPGAAAHVHPNNAVRVVRALEMVERGVSYAAQVSGFRRRNDYYRTKWIGVAYERPELYDRIEARIDAMVSQGWLAEVDSLVIAGHRDDLLARAPIGYPELVDVLEGSRTLDDALIDIKQSTRRYAKRQLTWFRADERIRWVIRHGDDIDSALARSLALL